MAADSIAGSASNGADSQEPASSSVRPKLGNLSADPASFEEVYEKYFDFVWRTARRLGVGMDAIDDVMQESFLVVHRRVDEPRESALRPWLYTITLQVVRNHRRTLRRRSPHASTGPVDPDTLATSSVNPETSVQMREASRILHEILDGFDDSLREVFVLVELEQLSVPEVAAVVGANLNTVYSRLRLAREAFDAAAKRHRVRDTRRNP